MNLWATLELPGMICIPIVFIGVVFGHWLGKENS
jgi:hypothetical protein